MNVWAISDLHLSFARPERRERFAMRWRDHVAKLEHQWRDAVGPEDLVLMPGDFSMARNHREVQPDLQWLERLPGTKVLGPGNHDRWWNRVEAVRRLLRRSMIAVDGDAQAVGPFLVCGAIGSPPRSSDVPAPTTTTTTSTSTSTTTSTTTGPRRAATPANRIDAALEQARLLRQCSGRPLQLLVLVHFPPFDAHGRPGPHVSALEAAGAAQCVYGHLHAQAQWSAATQGLVRGTHYHCVAADALGFRPLRICARVGLDS